MLASASARGKDTAPGGDVRNLVIGLERRHRLEGDDESCRHLVLERRESSSRGQFLGTHLANNRGCYSRQGERTFIRVT